MVRFLIQVIVIVILASMMELFLPWWSIAIASLIGGYVFRSDVNFIAGFISIALVWLVTALIIDITASTALTEKIATIFKMPKTALFAITAVLGGLVGGFAAMTGALLRKEKRRMKYY